jgi:hypothetical protein
MFKKRSWLGWVRVVKLFIFIDFTESRSARRLIMLHDDGGPMSRVSDQRRLAFSPNWRGLVADR